MLSCTVFFCAAPPEVVFGLALHKKPGLYALKQAAISPKLVLEWYTLGVYRVLHYRLQP